VAGKKNCGHRQIVLSLYQEIFHGIKNHFCERLPLSFGDKWWITKGVENATFKNDSVGEHGNEGSVGKLGHYGLLGHQSTYSVCLVGDFFSPLIYG